MIESYYVQFYMIINVGAVAGCIIIPVIARNNITAAYTIPFVLLLVALVFFVAGSKRYVHVIPGQHGHLKGNGGVKEEATIADDAKPNFADVAKVCLLIIPFSIVYQQCPTTCKRVSMFYPCILVINPLFLREHYLTFVCSHGPGSCHVTLPRLYRSAVDEHLRQ